MSNQGFSFKKFFEDSKKALLSPKEYFSTMETTGGIGEPVVKALIYGAIAGIFALIWSLLNLSASSGLFGGAVGFLALIWSIIAAVIGVFIGAVIVLIISSIAKGNSEFEPSMRVAAAIMVIMPISAFFGFLGGVRILSTVINLAINLYGLYLLYLAVTLVLKGEDKPAKIVSYVLGGLLILFFIIGLGTRSAVNKYEKETNKVLKEYQKAAEEAAKEIEKAAKEMDDE
ncbi:MAG: YIP1 family protein [Bacteroidota bacterium]|nr:YIP1 family protein [Bacteroidota bacterium]